ncbi:MAG: hypothetical protein RR759_02230 [Ruthenibacterium sp.]
MSNKAGIYSGNVRADIIRPYFVTICVKDRHQLLGEIMVGADIIRPPEPTLSQYGKTALQG